MQDSKIARYAKIAPPNVLSMDLATPGMPRIGNSASANPMGCDVLGCTIRERFSYGGHFLGFVILQVFLP